MCILSLKPQTHLQKEVMEGDGKTEAQRSANMTTVSQASILTQISSNLTTAVAMKPDTATPERMLKNQNFSQYKSTVTL